MGGTDNSKIIVGAATGVVLLVALIAIITVSSGGDEYESLSSPTFYRRISTCLDYATLEDENRNETEYRETCQVQGKRVIINPDKIPYNLSDVILWTLTDGNTVKSFQLENKEEEECYFFDRLEKVLATEVIATNRWRAIRLKQKFDKNRFNNYSGSYSDEGLFVAKGGSEKEIYVPEEGADTGLFASVLQAYKNHWILRTSPDDWFFPVIRRVAQVVDENALRPEVQSYLGKERIKTDLRVDFNRGFEAMFNELSSRISNNLINSEYARVFEANFSTTTDTDRMVSKLILMSSVQKYFNFDTYIACGIPEVELLGNEADWLKLIHKFKDIRKVLSPISGSLGGISDYFDRIVLPTAEKLLETYRGNVDKEWWNDIVRRQSSVEQVCVKMRKLVDRWDGWLVEYINGEEGQQMRDIASGLLTVPLQVKNTLFDLNYTATLVAGQIGFSLIEEEITVVKPFAGWAMLVTQDTEIYTRKTILETIRKRQKEREKIREARRRYNRRNHSY